MKRLGGVLVSGLIVVLLAACNGLAGQPEIVATLTPLPGVPVAQASEDKGYPEQMPDLQRGAEIYARHCTACHGETGNGNGDLVQKGQIPAMASFLDAEHMLTQRPDQYFDIITNGNIEKLMPPWKDTLSEQERWNVAHYLITLHYTPEQLALGEQLYTRECTECHGTTGMGDGEKQRNIGGEAYDLTYFKDFAMIADADVVDAIRYGKGNAMPAQDGILTDAEMVAIAAYTRGFSTTDSAGVAPAMDAQATIDPNVFTWQGTVSNGTAGASVPPSVPVTLRYGNAASGVQDLQTTTDENGTYRFADVPVGEGFVYRAFAMAGGQGYGSEVLESVPEARLVEMPIIIYETADDPAVIRVSQIDTRLEPFPQLEDESLGEGLLVTQTITFTNTSDRAFLLAQNERFFSVLIVMPPGSIALSALQDERFIVAQEQYAVIYTQPVIPGDNTLDMVYFLPYADGAVFDQPFNYPVEGLATVTISPTSVVLPDAGWVRAAEAPMVNQYTQTVTLAQGGSFVFNLKGAVSVVTATNSTMITGDVLVPIIAVSAFLLAALFLVVALRARRANPMAEVQVLMRQIADLDAMHTRGQINHDAWQRQRKSLKDRLTTLMASRPLQADNMAGATMNAEKPHTEE